MFVRIDAWRRVAMRSTRVRELAEAAPLVLVLLVIALVKPESDAGFSAAVAALLPLVLWTYHAVLDRLAEVRGSVRSGGQSGRVDSRGGQTTRAQKVLFAVVLAGAWVSLLLMMRHVVGDWWLAFYWPLWIVVVGFCFRADWRSSGVAMRAPGTGG